MRSINQIFRGNEHLMDLHPIEELIDYCSELEDKVIESEQLNKDQTVILKQVLLEIRNSCRDILKDDEDHERWPEIKEKPDFKEAIINLEEYICNYCRKNYIYL